MELQNDAHASTFRELLQSAGLRHHVTKTTHRRGHTLDLIIDRQESKIISNVYTVTDLPSDHNAVLCSIALERPKASKSHFKYRKRKNINMNAVKADILNRQCRCESSYEGIQLYFAGSYQQTCARSISFDLFASQRAVV